MLSRHILFISLMAVVLAAQAAEPKAERHLAFTTGTVTVGKNLASITLPPRTRYLTQADARYVVEEIWGNPADTSILGLILPAAPVADAADQAEQEWGIVVSWSSEGHVDDADAANINYSELLTHMQEGAKEGNDERSKAGYPSVELLGWAEPPHYDPATHKLFWAKSLRFGKSTEPELNYCVRILAKDGVLELNAVDATKNLKPVAQASQLVLAGVQMSSGHRYEDFKAGVDPVAAGGITALIVGGLAAKKLGLIAVFGVFLLKAWKLVALAVFGVSVGVKRWLGRNQSQT